MTRKLPGLATYAVLIVAALLTLGPVWWTFTTSLRPAAVGAPGGAAGIPRIRWTADRTG